MKNIKSIILEKYRNEQKYEAIENDIYKDLKNKRYAITLRFDLEEHEDSQYPLEDILDRYYVNCTSHIIANGKTMEVEFEDGNDDNFESLNAIKEIASLVGKRIYSREQAGYLELVIK